MPCTPGLFLYAHFINAFHSNLLIWQFTHWWTIKSHQRAVPASDLHARLNYLVQEKLVSRNIFMCVIVHRLDGSVIYSLWSVKVTTFKVPHQAKKTKQKTEMSLICAPVFWKAKAQGKKTPATFIFDWLSVYHGSSEWTPISSHLLPDRT